MGTPICSGGGEEKMMTFLSGNVPDTCNPCSDFTTRWLRNLVNQPYTYQFQCFSRKDVRLTYNKEL